MLLITNLQLVTTRRFPLAQETLCYPKIPPIPWREPKALFLSFQQISGGFAYVAYELMWQPQATTGTANASGGAIDASTFLESGFPLGISRRDRATLMSESEALL